MYFYRFNTNGAQILTMSKISIIKKLLNTINIEDYIYVSGFFSKATSADDIVRSATALEASETLIGTNSLLQNADTLMKTVGYISINQCVPWRLDSESSTWQRVVQIDNSHQDIESVAQSPPVLALCLVHPNRATELLIVRMPAAYGTTELGMFHSGGLQILASSPQFDNARITNLLSSAERKCLVWCARGKTSYEMGLILGLSEHTINHYLGRVQRKLDVSSRAQAVAAAIKNGVIELESLD